jgi:hypothetical protein
MLSLRKPCQAVFYHNGNGGAMRYQAAVDISGMRGVKFFVGFLE